MECKTCGRGLSPSQTYTHVLMGGSYCKRCLFTAVSKWKKGDEPVKSDNLKKLEEWVESGNWTNEKTP